jgi:hypothetical protein
MSGIPKNVIYTVARLHCKLSDGIGHVREISGTGFWLEHDRGKPVFVTNRHNVDASVWKENPHDLKLVEARIELRRRGEQDEFLDDTVFVTLEGLPNCFKSHPSADCAILTDTRGVIPPGYGKVTPVALSMIADSAGLSDNARIMDLVSFVGFPGQTCAWWDEAANLPIARLASLASDPSRPFVNAAIRTTDVTLVSGLSFSGSSGSPVFLHEKGIRVSAPLSGGGHIPAQVIGIMSGHLQDREPDEELLRHTGLSYFTRSTSILELVRGAV